MKNLQKRIISAIVFGIIVLGSIGIHAISCYLLFVIIQSVMIYEYHSMLKVRYRDEKRNTFSFYISIILAFLIFGTSVFIARDYAEFDVLILFLLIPTIFGTIELFSKSKRPFTHFGLNFLGLVYIALPIALIPFLAEFDGSYSPKYILSFLFLNWANDVFAYFIGSSMGKRPLAKMISPKKTIEGFFGGLFSTVICAVLAGFCFDFLSMIEWIGLAIIISVFGTLGDLTESMLKRSAGVKDSGSIMPGHGGLLDRFDAFIMIVPVATVYLWLISS